ncbi:Proteasome subunit beta type-1 [Brettanomyces bruxellensis]|uniref:Proteasome subunit beta n=1 Tax=Dekkera bruxellensis TaxID=5007 RepID=A0A3F2Y8P4_DEKBR|nr:Proteasome subunit beta type-1 [Brettanomyces bruxellensis]KAF6005877.1 Proteasome subunit beta type-1 [Brettanomyces bruxellensis]QOU21528.1 Proteasome subunit beta type-1 [Brettanomyces bruxellensis]VUG19026.1 PRE3 [Brettanomyces bruxellensis]
MDTISVDVTHLKKGEVSMGTSIMAVTFKDGVILGSDSRTTSGAYIANRVTDKLTQLQDKIWCCRSGSAADTQAVADMVRYQMDLYQSMNGKEPGTELAASVFQEICYNNKDMLTAGIIIAGYDQKKGGQVFVVPLGGSLHQDEYAISGSGSAFIYGYCKKNFKPDMTKEQTINFMKSSLSQAIRWDGSSGGVIRMVVLTANGIERLIFYPEEYVNA